MTTSVEIDAAWEVAAHLPLVDVPDQLLNLAEVLRRPDPAVAIVGLVSRGKSTLLNKLCGAIVSKPS
ncbi:MAG: 50S ribosome-binding GTPase, partial [Chloroflexi bacterium]|nr:50S ribosome-binding GTPase [Chloroflexota bacterium]